MRSLVKRKRTNAAAVALFLSSLLTLSAVAPFQPTNAHFHNYFNSRCRHCQSSSPPPPPPPSSSSTITRTTRTSNTPETLLERRQRCYLSQLHASATAPISATPKRMMEWAGKLVPDSLPSFRTKQSTNNRKGKNKTSKTKLSNIKEAEYQRRKEEWANRYTNVDSLRETFGANRNKLWGDLDAPTARRLYKTLLPTALLELVKAGVKPEDLAPLAYQARVAAKLYARERCQIPARTAAQLYDGFRQWKRYGQFQTSGMTYDQVWEKYSKLITQDGCEGHDQEECALEPTSHCASTPNTNDLTDEDVTAKICLKILERSCATNESIDRWVLPPEDQEQREDLALITQKLEDDVRKLLLPITDTATSGSILNSNKDHINHHKQQKKNVSIQKYRTLRLVARARRRARRYHSAKHNNSDNANTNRIDNSSYMLTTTSTTSTTNLKKAKSQQQDRQQKLLHAQRSEDNDHIHSRDNNIGDLQLLQSATTTSFYKPWRDRTSRVHHRQRLWESRTRQD